MQVRCAWCDARLGPMLLPDPSGGDGVARSRERRSAKEGLMNTTELSDSYVLGRSDAETRRLILQHQIYGPLTRRLFEAAGIGAGMTVLDVGSGAGDVTLLLADLVGPRGRVLGVEQNAAIVDVARRRVQAAGWRNVTFHVGDVRDAPLAAGLDAVVGRWVLMYQPDPAALLRGLAARLRPGGVIAFHENDFSYPPTTFPPSELSQQIQRWSIPSSNVQGGPDVRTGTKLFRLFLEAGLPPPELRLEAPVGGGPDWPGYEYVAETLRSLLPALQRFAGLDPAEVDVDTLAERIRQDAVAGGRVQMLPIMIGAWARTQG
jgi:SAM-dependent methyltransferase